MGIPNKINPMTGGDILPRGYIAAEFLESTGNAKIQVPFSFSLSQDEVRVEMETSISLGNVSIQREGYISGTNSLTIGQYNKQFSVTVGNGTGTESTDLIVGAFYKVWCNFTGQGYSFGSGTTVWNSKVQNYNNNVLFYNLFNADLPWQTKRKWWKAYKNQKLQFDLIPALDSQGQPIFYNKVDGTAYGNTGTGSFIVGMTVSQARYLRNLPVVESGALTVSLPWEAQYDTGVQNALSIAAARGWTITVQYRDPEVATKNIPIGFLESNADSLIWFAAPTPATSAEIELDIQYTQTRESYQATCGIAGHTGNWVAADGTRYMLYSAIEGTNVLERSVILYKWNATPDNPSYAGQSSLSVQGITSTSPARNTTAATGVAMLNYDNGGWNPYYSFARVWSVRAKVGDWEVKGTPRLTTKGVPVMYDVASKTEYPPTKGNKFIAGFDTAIQARNLAHLPDVTAETDAAKKSLTVSLPWEAQWDEGVQAALQVAADRGWTITVQYREPEITTKNIPIGFLEGIPGYGRIYFQTGVFTSDQTGMFVRFSLINDHDGYPMGGSVDNYRRCQPYRVNANNSALGGWNEQFYAYPTVNLTDVFTSSVNFKNDRKITLNKNNFSSSDNIKPLTVDSREIYLFADSAFSNYYWRGRIYEAAISKEASLIRAFKPAIDALGMLCMYDSVTKQSFYNSGTGRLIAGFNTVEQARSLAYLPDVTSETDVTKKSLTVSLPWEAQLVTTYVPAALQVAADRGWTITVQYRDPEADNAYYNKYAACTTTAEVAAVNADYQNDLTADGEWIYPLPELVDGEQLFYEVKNLHIFNMTLPKLKKANQMFGFSGLIKISIIAPLLEDATTLIYSLPSLEEVYFELPVCTNYNYFMPGAGKARRVIGSFALCKTAAAAFNINRSLEEIDARFPALEGGTRLFDGCQLKKQFALDCLNSIPSYTSGTHNIMLGIHIDYQNDTDVLTAIADAEAKGWTLTVQWNGTATAAAASVSTFGLRSPAIYAKLGTVERPDGTTESVLDWGHYVTNWEENGYQEFSSIEEAEEYFNINQTEEL